MGTWTRRIYEGERVWLRVIPSTKRRERCLDTEFDDNGFSLCLLLYLSVQAMQNYAITNNLTPFISMQNFHNLAYREEEREMFPTLKYFGVGCIPWSPLSRGFLTRPANEKTLRTESDGGYKGRNEGALEEINLRVQKVAKDKGVTMAQVSGRVERDKMVNLARWRSDQPGRKASTDGQLMNL